MDIIITGIVGIVATIISSLVLFFMQRFFMQQHKRDEDRDRIKAEEYGLILQSLEALGKLTVANSVALRDGRTNGELSSALREYEEVEKEMHRHLILVHAKDYEGP